MAIQYILRACTLAATLAAPAVDAPIDVRLLDDRIRTGSVDSSTNDTHLRLRIGDTRAFLVFAIPWSEIREIQSGEKTWAPEEFRRLRAALAVTRANGNSDTKPLITDPPTTQTDDDRHDRAHHRPKSPRVQYLQIDAAAENWDADPEWDGIALRLQPISRDDELIAVSGTLDVTLVGDRAYSVPHLDSSSTPVQRIGHWTRRLKVSEFGRNGALVRLEFQDVLPEYGLGNSFGEVQVRLSVPSQGSFSATSLPIRLRRFSPVRDRFWRQHGNVPYPFE